MIRNFLNGIFLGAVLTFGYHVWHLVQLVEPAQAQPAAIRAQVAPLKTAVRQLKSGKWRLTLETSDASAGRLQKGQSVQVLVK